MRIMLALLVAVSVSACSRSLGMERDLNNAVSELDRSIWGNLDPIVPAADVPKVPPLK
jgi:hypothetical protein